MNIFADYWTQPCIEKNVESRVGTVPHKCGAQSSEEGLRKQGLNRWNNKRLVITGGALNHMNSPHRVQSVRVDLSTGRFQPTFDNSHRCHCCCCNQSRRCSNGLRDKCEQLSKRLKISLTMVVVGPIWLLSLDATAIADS